MLNTRSEPKLKFGEVINFLQKEVLTIIVAIRTTIKCVATGLK